MTANDRITGFSEVRVSQIAPATTAHRPEEAVLLHSYKRVDDNTHISTVSRLTQQGMSVSEVRMDKVAAVQQALTEGTYQVSPSDVAEKMIEHMKESR